MAETSRFRSPSRSGSSVPMPAPGELLLRCLGNDPDAAPGVLHGLPPDGWRGLVREAVRHEVEALLFQRLQEAVPKPAVPPDVEQELRVMYACSALRSRALQAQLCTVLCALRERGIPVIVLKGAYLAEAVYDDGALRPMSDLDLLVPVEALSATEQLLVELGYGPVPRPDVEATRAWCHHLVPFRKQGAASVEIHWTIERPGSPFRIDVGGFWERASRRSRGHWGSGAVARRPGAAPLPPRRIPPPVRGRPRGGRAAEAAVRRRRYRSPLREPAAVGTGEVHRRKVGREPVRLLHAGASEKSAGRRDPVEISR
jgi:hypothetical protein